MTIIQLKKRLYVVPTSWNELSQSQLLRITKILYSDITVIKAQLLLLRILTGMTIFRFMRVSVMEINDYLYLTEFYYTKNDLIKNLLPVYRGFYGPKDDFDNLTGAEFTFTELYYGDYIENKSEISLNKLIGILYRPGKLNYNKKINQDGDIREKFNRHIVDHYARKVIKWPRYIKMAVVAWYAGSRSNLSKSNPEIFGSGSGQPPQYGMWSIMRNIAEKGNHGDFEKIEVMLVKEMMMELNEIIFESKRISSLKPTL